MTYKLRFFLDWGSGTILWSGDDKTKEQYGYPIDHHDLDLSDDLIKEIDDVLEEYDSAFDPQENVDSDSFKISDIERKNLNNKIHELFIKIQKELGKDFEIVDEYDDL